jgi:hypothetical protein
MYDKAVEKLNNQMAANEKHPYVQIIGQYLLNHLEGKPEDAEKFLDDDKTILKSIDTMRRFAETRRVGNMAMLTDEEGFGVVLQYFGCWQGEPFNIPVEPQRPVPVPRTAPQPVHNKSSALSAVKNNAQNKPFVQMSLFDASDDVDGREVQ